MSEAATTWALIVGPYILILSLAIALRSYRRRRPRGVLLDQYSDTEPSKVFVLVHGTWAQNALWTSVESELCRELRDEFPGTLIRRFSWSGRNSIRSRARAASELRNFIKESVAIYPAAKHFLIAHSHGGNVALSAIAGASDAVDGLICLATPVLVFRERRLDELSTALLPAVAVGPPLLLWWTGVKGAVALALIWLALVGVTQLASKLWRHTLDAITPHALPSSLSPKLLFVRAPGDEAAGAISALATMSWLLTRALTLPARAYDAAQIEISSWREIVSRHQVTIFILALVWLALFGVVYSYINAILPVYNYDRPYDDWATEHRNIKDFAIFLFGFPLWMALLFFLGGVVTFLALVIVLPLFLAVIFVVSAVAGLSVGIEMSLAALTMELSVEPCPEGFWQVAIIPADAWSPNGSLQHSAVYETPEARSVMFEWLRHRC